MSKRRIITYEECRETALKYKRRGELQLVDPSIYCKIKKNEWFELFSHMEKSHSEKRFTKEEILISAKKYENQRDWLKNEPSVFSCAAGYNKKNSCKEDKEFWLECTKHMKFIFKPNGWWTYERCKEDALRYTILKEFREKSHAYVVILKNGWWDELCGHITSTVKPHGYWTYERCKETAIKYNDRGKLSKEHSTCYATIKKNGWDELISHIKYKSNQQYRYIYSFEFPDKHVYVGLTYNINKRKSDHLTTEKKVSPVVQHMRETGLEFTFKTLFDGPFHKDVAGEMEKQALQDYIDSGWVPLNKAKPGGLGGSKLKWTYEKLKKELDGVKTLSELKERIPNHAFHVIRKYGWWDDFVTPLKIDVRISWTMERALEEMKKYETRSQIQHNQRGLYKFLLRNNLLEQIPKRKPTRKLLLKDKFTKEEVYERCLSYSKAEELKEKDREYYTCAKNNGWWDDIVEQITKKRGFKSKYSYEDCLNETLKYKHKSDFMESNSGMMKVIKKNGWWDELSKHMTPKPRDRYTLDEIIKECEGYTSRGKLQKEKSGVFKYLQRHNLLDKLIPLHNPKQLKLL